ncbi:PREDICTED: uncharacterized protein LOC104751359 [Camelina sativa]|uniref:Uncharacterized protein LOC104751359 n=1 Tax=Camelina sativa TaxID=90675 RepID=A0ABM0WIL1_CAMSA|nr:PREDICTED: uncharacterized protein LOC104751359 [Camelina sativa]
MNYCHYIRTYIIKHRWTENPGQSRGPAVDGRKLEDIDDEEFNIPPLFDDTEYVREEIPDLDIEDDGKACEMKESGYYVIRKANLEHTCPIETRNKYLKKATSKVNAAVYEAKYSDLTKGLTPLDLQHMVLEDLRVAAPYSKCWRAKGKALEGIFGSDDESFEDLPGFRKLRRVIVVDGTHLNGKYNGVLLTASGQDANLQVFPLALAVVDNENDEAWSWFFEKLERIIADSKSLTIILDRNSSIYTTKKRMFLLAHHRACIVHLARNVNARFHNKGLAKLVTNATFVYKVTCYQEIYRQIKVKNANCAAYLDKIRAAHWSRAYF